MLLSCSPDSGFKFLGILYTNSSHSVSRLSLPSQEGGRHPCVTLTTSEGGWGVAIWGEFGWSLDMWYAVSKLKHVWSLIVQMEPRVMDGYPHVALFLHKTLRSLQTPSLNLTFCSSSTYCCQGSKTEHIFLTVGLHYILVWGLTCVRGRSVQNHVRRHAGWPLVLEFPGEPWFLSPIISYPKTQIAGLRPFLIFWVLSKINMFVSRHYIREFYKSFKLSSSQ